MNKTRVRLAALLLAVSFALSGCSLVKNIGGSSGAGTKTITRPAVESAELQFTHPAAGEPVAVFDTTAGVFRAVLFPEQAPQAYDNFVGLVQAGYYNGLTVTRVEQDFVVEAGQGADGKGTTIWNGSRYPAEATDTLRSFRPTRPPAAHPTSTTPIPCWVRCTRGWTWWTPSLRPPWMRTRSPRKRSPSTASALRHIRRSNN